VTKKKKTSHRIVRWIIQLLFLALFIFLFGMTKYGRPFGIQNLFFHFDPLVLIIISIAYRTIIAAALLSGFVIIGTLICGRFFCGYICPFGTVLDICRRAFSPRTRTDASFKSGKYLILLFLLVSALIGSSFLHFFDPLVILERSLTLLAYPVISFFSGLVALVTTAVFVETGIALLTLIVILTLSTLFSRFWCRSLCPLGGFLAFLSRFSVFKFFFKNECSACGICASVCPTSAIDYEKRSIDAAECINCLRCLYECPQQTITYAPHISAGKVDFQRRHFATTVLASIVAVPLVRSLLHTKLHGRLIRPPGAIPEPDFVNVCIHCGKCMKVCPTNGLQPCVFEAGVNGLWTPRLIPRIGGCEKNCNMCGRVCPTSAIRKLPLEEKTYAKMGTAVIDRSRCIAWEQDKVCLICDEACPYNAISSLNETVRDVTLLRPFVDERICTGCGLCEARCPIEGPAAIEVFSIGEERKRTGSYITQEKVQLRACEEKEEDIPSGFILD
jgi:MauM/NapG family ferredoxin protein